MIDKIIIKGTNRALLLDSEDSKIAVTLEQFCSYSPLETYLICKKLRPGQTFVDLGAHIGYFTVLMADLVGSSGKGFAFEPSARNFTFLKRNMEINGFENVRLENAAVADETKMGKLYLHDTNTGDHRIYKSRLLDHPNEPSNRVEADVKIYGLDDYFKEFDGTIDFIKMDIQGSEWKALKGMAKILDKAEHMKIIMEFCPRMVYDNGGDPRSMLENLAGFGFKLFLSPQGNTGFRKTSIDEVLEMFPIKEWRWTNLWWEK